MLKPTIGRVIINPEPENTESVTGIITTTNTDKQTCYGKVEVIGEDVHSCKVGDRVLYNHFMGDEVKDGEDKFVVIASTEILCILE